MRLTDNRIQDIIKKHGTAYRGARVMPSSQGARGLSTSPPDKQSFLRQLGHRGGAPSFLVEYLHKSADEHNSAQVGSSTKSPVDAEEIERQHPCENWRSIRGSCAHGSVRWLYVRCKRRDCSGCSKVRQWQYASRIAAGVRSIGTERCAFIVLTYGEKEAVNPEFKPEAVKRENSFIRWLRSEQKKIGNNVTLEYAKTWEVTKAGRLHTNIIVGPWKYDPLHRPGRYIDVDSIRDRWGARISISTVKEDESIAREATKALSPDGLSTYLTKVEQMVPEEWHRAISFSKGFPKLGKYEAPERVGCILWESERQLGKGAAAAFFHEKSIGWWGEVEEGRGEFIDLVKPESCQCFDWKPPPLPKEYFPPTAKHETDLHSIDEVQVRELAELYS